MKCEGQSSDRPPSSEVWKILRCVSPSFVAYSRHVNEHTVLAHCGNTALSVPHMTMR